MRITWYGHAAFLIEAQGLRIILDPYRSPDSGGYEPIADGADVVIVSHENDRYHSHLGQIVPPFQTVRGLELGPEGTTIGGIRIDAFKVFESPERLPVDLVTMISLRADGVHLVFLGDLGHRLTEDEVRPLRGAEIVLVPAGGPPTIHLGEVPALLDAIGPRLVIPMHFKTPKINLNIQPLERFLDVVAGDPIRRTGTSSIEVTRDSLPSRRMIVVLEHAR